MKHLITYAGQPIVNTTWLCSFYCTESEKFSEIHFVMAFQNNIKWQFCKSTEDKTSFEMVPDYEERDRAFRAIMETKVYDLQYFNEGR